MEKMQEFALKFRRQSSLPPLSPLPVLRANPASPCRKVSENHSLYIRTLKPNKTNKMFTSPMKPMSYSFSSSPAKVLFCNTLYCSSFFLALLYLFNIFFRILIASMRWCAPLTVAAAKLGSGCWSMTATTRMASAALPSSS